MTRRSVLRRRGVVALLVVAAVPLMLAADRGLGRLLAGPRGLELGGAEWIWAPRVSSWSGPTAFLALRDLELPAAPSSARLLALADEEYVLFVNGKIVGAGRYRAGEPMDAYELAPVLRPGNNRIVFELRSGRGVGGFLARLRVELPGREPVRLVTDEDWKIAYRHRDGLGDPSVMPLPPLPQALVLARPPFGRWGPRRPGPLRVRFEEALERPRDWVRVWTPRADGEWRRSGVRRPARGERVLIDFGREEAGFLVLAGLGRADEPALVYTGLREPHPEDTSPSAVWISLPGKVHWVDAEPRRFRYALVVGGEGVHSASVYGIRDAAAAAWPAAPERRRGVFGLTPVQLRTPIEDKIWSQLQGATGR